MSQNETHVQAVHEKHTKKKVCSFPYIEVILGPTRPLTILELLEFSGLAPNEQEGQGEEGLP